MTALKIIASANLPFNDQQWTKLREAVGSDELKLVSDSDPAGTAAALETAEVAILAGDLDDRFIAAPKLKWVHCDHSGLTKSAKPAVFERGLIVTGSAGRSGGALAEHVMMFSLLLASRYTEFYEAQKRHEWHRPPEIHDLRALYGRTMGIIGMGHTGAELAKRASAFGMRVLGYRRRDQPAPEGVERVYSADKGETIDPILAEADILALVINLSDATYHMIDERALSRMKPGAIIVNLARGAVVDQDALITALKAGRIGGYGTDVTTPEPLPPGHPLWDTPNVLITPHFTPMLPDRVDRSLGMIIENLRRYRVGEPMLNRMSAEDVWTH